ncbi:c-type cytochrome [Edaphobacter albus]|uniref:c-type cytochrome n=1 Tax=Edaphobacter sp. 4G125 TaxID=2763071 RepID=UPI001645D5B0|nr:cytochrome c [Edaphobacter sp. 4G125]QNI38169.1 cytochrome c [Edaphobacter sp. 4G125]
MLKPFFCCTLLLASSPQQPTPGPSPTVIPAEAVRMVNPVKTTPESLAHAKKLYGYDCALCHGTIGDGKGDAVADMKLQMKDYTNPATLKDMTDGELFYIIRNGKGQMPAEEIARAKDDDVWNLVVLVRSFSKK